MQCFIISPIGQPGSHIREHADDVFECIIDPALKEARVDGHRADHVKDVGRITKQMYNDILSADFCIAVLHGFNPNVFYELAVAHSAGVPVILLSEKGIDPPFDLKDERVLHYDLTPRAIYKGDNIRELLTKIESVRRLQGLREVPFGNGLTPLNAAVSRRPYTLSDETNATAEHWLQLVRGARERLYLGGIGFTGWRGIPGMKEALAVKATSGCVVRVLTMDADNPASTLMVNPEITSLDKGRLEETRAWFQTAIGVSETSQVRALRTGVLFQQIIVADNQAWISPYLFSTTTSFSPCLALDESSKVFETFVREFDELWRLQAPGRADAPPCPA